MLPNAEQATPDSVSNTAFVVEAKVGACITGQNSLYDGL